jgi:Double zinc ribbon
MLLALFGITNDGLNLFVNLVVLCLVVLWIALIAWTYFDARRRIRDPFLVACAAAASIFPFVGTIVYSILRPPEFIEDARERELETRAAELRVRQLEEQSCPNCGYPIERTYLRCPNCRARVKNPCETCEKPIDPRWAICPYCETPQRRAAPQPRRRPAEEAPSKPAPSRGAKPERSARRPQRAPRKPRQERPAAARQSSASRASSETKQRKPATRSTSSSPPSREGPGEEGPRPATAS